MTVRVGLVGLGVMGTVHFNAYTTIADAEVTALCDIEPRRMEADWPGTQGNIDAGGSIDRAGAPARTYRDFRGLVRDADIDAVDLCVPSDLHAEMAVEALQAGKHVFCEKPMALAAAAAGRMLAAAEAGGKLLMIGHVLRFWPEYLLIREMIESRRFGPLRSSRFWRWGGAPAWGGQSWFTDSARSGGAAMDLHIHDADAVQWLLGPPARVTGHGSVTGDGGVDAIWTRYHYDGGPVVMSDGGWLPGAYPFAMGATLAFERAAVEYHSGRKPGLSVFAADGGIEHPDVPAADAYAEELAYFIGCVAAGAALRSSASLRSTSTPGDRADPADAARAVAIVEAEIQSVKTGRTVAIEA